MINVYSLPRPTEARADLTNAIHRCVVMLEKYLPEYGFVLNEDPNMADLIVGNAGQTGGVGRVDVAMCHGLYPTADDERTVGWHYAANQAVIQNLRAAKQITVPSEWVAQILRRDMHVNPHVVGWGIEPDEWTPGEDGNYTLWNKTRDDGVCTPQPILDLAARLPNARFLTTFGQGTPNVKTIGRQPYAAMRELVRSASVYLATTLETFGIGTLEAMASGVPVLGFRWGGTADLVQHGITGYLVEPGDIEGLAEGYSYCIAHRTTLGANAREVALTHTWDKVAASMAEVYHLALQPHTGPKVSVVILSHNYSHYLPGAIESVQRQQTNFEFEIIGVDNGSSDDTATIFKAAEVRLIQRPNDGPANGRNAGISAARGESIVCLDADDQLGHPNFLQVLSDALDADPTLGIAFTGLRLMDADGEIGKQTNWPNGYSFDLQMTAMNQVPTCCMFRKEAWRRAGGYRTRYTPAEDANLWLRMGALGYGGKQVTSEPWFLYRWHDKSLSTPVRTRAMQEPNWRDFPWIEDRKLPFAADGTPNNHSWPVRNYIRAKVTVIIPVGEGHQELLKEALDSIEAQSERNWECIVINDTTAALDLTAYPWARVLSTGGKKGAGYARNRGIEAAKTKLITFLDADDTFDIHFLELTLRDYALSGKYIYTDWRSLNKVGRYEVHETPPFDPNDVFRRTSMHSINVLIPREWALTVGGFDETMYSAEDVDFFMKLAAAGYCGKRLQQPLVTYRYLTGSLRDKGTDGTRLNADILALLNSRYGEYIRGEKQITCQELKRITTLQEGNYRTFPSNNGHGDMVRVEYRGATARQTVLGPVTKQNYGRRGNGDLMLVWQADLVAAPDKFLPIADFFDDIQPTPVPDEPELIADVQVR